MAALLPDGTASANADAVRQSALSSFFYSAGNLLAGMDNASRMGNVQNDASGTGGPDLLGYGTANGVDVGIGANGEVYVRGNVGQVGTQDQVANSGQAAKPAAISPLALLLIVGAAVLLLK
jgi:hypothetical protein